MNAERARLREWIQSADQQAARCERALGALTQQRAEHHAEYEQQAQIVATADAHIVHVRAEVAAPLVEQATADGTGYLTARQRMWQANRALDTTARFGRRAAGRTVREATEAHGAAEEVMRRRWGAVPQTPAGVAAWAETIAGQGADADPRVVEARQGAARAHQQLRHLTVRHADARAALWRSICERPSSLEARATELRRGVERARRTLAEIEALPVTEAAQLIQDRAARAAAKRTAEAASRARAAEPRPWGSPSPVYRPGAERGFGPSR